jgi:hypothetical protein
VGSQSEKINRTTQTSHPHPIIVVMVVKEIYGFNINRFSLNEWSSMSDEKKFDLENELIQNLQRTARTITPLEASFFLELCSKYNFNRAIDDFIDFGVVFDINTDVITECARWRNAKALDHILKMYSVFNVKIKYSSTHDEYWWHFLTNDVNLLTIILYGEFCILDVLLEKMYFDGDAPISFSDDNTLAIIDVFAKYGFSVHHTFYLVGDRDERPRLLATTEYDNTDLVKAILKKYPLTRDILIKTTIPRHFGVSVSNVETKQDGCVVVTGESYSDFMDYDKIFISKKDVVKFEFRPEFSTVDDTFGMCWRTDTADGWQGNVNVKLLNC